MSQISLFLSEVRIEKLREVFPTLTEEKAKTLYALATSFRNEIIGRIIESENKEQTIEQLVPQAFGFLVQIGLLLYHLPTKENFVHGNYEKLRAEINQQIHDEHTRQLMLDSLEIWEENDIVTSDMRTDTEKIVILIGLLRTQDGLSLVSNYLVTLTKVLMAGGSAIDAMPKKPEAVIVLAHLSKKYADSLETLVSTLRVMTDQKFERLRVPQTDKEAFDDSIPFDESLLT